ncbi:MAG: peptide deformylase [Flavobacteriales bacterium]|nr:peptide deformylase [Flavobacteriales bacterium]
MLREIVVLGDSRLLLPCVTVPFPLSTEVMEVIRDLLDTMHHTKGVGLAANQIGETDRVFTLTTQHTQRKGVPRLAPLVFINPSITDHSPDLMLDHEGCISTSIDGKAAIRGVVARHRWVELEWQDEKGRSHRKRFEDFLARIVQHELDHLNGRLYLHRLATVDDLVMESYYQQHHRPKLI